MHTVMTVPARLDSLSKGIESTHPRPASVSRSIAPPPGTGNETSPKMKKELNSRLIEIISHDLSLYVTKL